MLSYKSVYAGMQNMSVLGCQLIISHVISGMRLRSVDTKWTDCRHSLYKIRVGSTIQCGTHDTNPSCFNHPVWNPTFVAQYVSMRLINIWGYRTKAEMRNKKMRITSRHPIDGLYAFILVSHATVAVQDVSLQLLNIWGNRIKAAGLSYRETHTELHIDY